MAWKPDFVRSQDYFSCLRVISQNPKGQNIVWDYVRKNWPNFVNRFSLNDRSMGRMIPAITSGFNTKAKLKEMEDFFIEYPDAGAGDAARTEAFEKVKNNILWLKTHEGTIQYSVNYLNNPNP